MAISASSRSYREVAWLSGPNKGGLSSRLYFQQERFLSV